MADNVTLDAGAGGATLGADDIAGIHYQRVKLIEGADGTNDGDVSSANPLPVQISDGTDAALVDGSGNLNAILAANSGVDIGDVDVASVPAPLSTTGGGTEAAALRVTIANDSTGVVSIDDNAGSLTVDGTVTANAGSGTMTVTDDGSFTLAANSGVDIGDVDVTSIAAGANLIGDVGLQPRTSGGLSFFKSVDLDETEEEVKGSAGQVYGYYLYNDHASSKRYVKFYNNTAAGVTVGTTVPDLTIPLDAGQGANVSIPQGLAFGTGITVAATTGVADNDAGAPGANEVICNVWYA